MDVSGRGVVLVLVHVLVNFVVVLSIGAAVVSNCSTVEELPGIGIGLMDGTREIEVVDSVLEDIDVETVVTIGMIID